MFGTQLSEAYRQEVIFGDVEPSIAFANKKAIYLSSAGLKNIGLNIINVPKVEVKLYKVYSNNVLTYLREKNLDNNNSRSGDYYDYYGYTDMADFADIVYDKEVETSSLDQAAGMYLYPLDFEALNQRNGLVRT